jgi:hypothetical protein
LAAAQTNTLCQTSNGGCDPNASCAPDGLYNVICTCNTGFQGPGNNGYYCPPTVTDPPATQTGGNGGQPQFGNWDCPSPSANFWDWRYAAPTCSALTVIYPANLPDDQTNDVNVRIRLADGVTTITLNFHKNDGVWTGQTTFDFHSHSLFPAGATGYTVEWVQVGGSNCHWHGSVTCNPPTPEGPGEEQPPFNWNWEYPAPTCQGLTVTYPSDIPSGQSNDVNIRIIVNGVSYTLNFHNNNAFWSGVTVFDIIHHPLFPNGENVRFTIVWVQVGGTNYHWQGSVSCP